MVETEIKVRAKDMDSARAMLRRAGFRVLRRRIFEVNLVLDTDDLQLRKSERLLRLRKAGKQITLTFKGPAQPGRHKRREELEVRLGDFEAGLQIFQQIGMKAVFRYEKFRTEFQQAGSKDGLAMLDETPLGVFVELEGASSWIDATARKMGVARREYLTASYGALYFQHCQDQGLTPSHMVFS